MGFTDWVSDHVVQPFLNPIDVPGPVDLPSPVSTVGGALAVPFTIRDIAQNATNIFGGDKPADASAASATGATGTVDPNQLRGTLSSIAAQLGVSPTPYLASLDITGQLDKSTGQQTDYNSVARSLVQQMQTDAQQQRAQTQSDVQALRQQASDQKFALALQQQASTFFQPFIQNILQSGQTSADALSSLASTAPPGFQGVFQAQAQSALASAQRLAGAYGMQAMLSPTTYYQGILAQTQQAQLDNAYKQSQIQQNNAMAAYYMAGAQNGGPGAGSSSSGTFEDFLASQGQKTGASGASSSSSGG